ncbi:MAG: hypothetical protein QXY10_02945 [Candidatus Micrarchaeaceae archaeon]
MAYDATDVYQELHYDNVKAVSQQTIEISTNRRDQKAKIMANGDQ